MKALIDTIFSPVTAWLTQILELIQSVTLPSGYTLSFSNIFNPIAIMSPAWAAVVSNLLFMLVTYSIIFVIMNAKDLFLQFKSAYKFW